MKKILILIIILLMPINVFAYSEYIIPGGETIGININGDGVIVMGFYKVENTYINGFLRPGDKIIKVNDIVVSSVEELSREIENNILDNKVNITYIRDDIEYVDYLELKLINGIYKSGLYIKSNIVGIGTLTYIDENIYGALGHVVNYGTINKKVEIKDGMTFFSDVTNFIRSRNGNPGSKSADIIYDKEFGSIDSNTNYGIYGYVKSKNDKELMEVGKLNDVMLGSASIYTTNLDDEVVEYEIKILEIDKESKDKNFYFEVVDKDLLEMSGGIVQGMSGSPIIQNDKIIGAVTRVLIDDVKKGYGISIVTMLEEGDKLAE
jgi:stage IV sporulation protein B